MPLADVDLLATSGATGLHRAHPTAKLVGFALVVATVVVAEDVQTVLITAAVLLVAGSGEAKKKKKTAPASGLAGAKARLGDPGLRSTDMVEALAFTQDGSVVVAVAR